MAKVKVIKQPKIKKEKVNTEFKEVKKDNGNSGEADGEEGEEEEFSDEEFSDFGTIERRASPILKAEDRRQAEADIEDKVENAKTNNSPVGTTQLSYTPNAYNMPGYGNGKYDNEERNAPRLRSAESLSLGTEQNLFRQQRQEWNEGDEARAWVGDRQVQETNMKTYIDGRVKEKPVKRSRAVV